MSASRPRFTNRLHSRTRWPSCRALTIEIAKVDIAFPTALRRCGIAPSKEVERQQAAALDMLCRLKVTKKEMGE